MAAIIKVGSFPSELGYARAAFGYPGGSPERQRQPNLLLDLLPPLLEEVLAFLGEPKDTLKLLRGTSKSVARLAQQHPGLWAHVPNVFARARGEHDLPSHGVADILSSIAPGIRSLSLRTAPIWPQVWPSTHVAAVVAQCQQLRELRLDFIPIDDLLLAALEGLAPSLEAFHYMLPPHEGGSFLQVVNRPRSEAVAVLQRLFQGLRSLSIYQDAAFEVLGHQELLRPPRGRLRSLVFHPVRIGDDTPFVSEHLELLIAGRQGFDGGDQANSILEELTSHGINVGSIVLRAVSSGHLSRLRKLSLSPINDRKAEEILRALPAGCPGLTELDWGCAGPRKLLVSPASLATAIQKLPLESLDLLAYDLARGEPHLAAMRDLHRGLLGCASLRRLKIDGNSFAALLELSIEATRGGRAGATPVLDFGRLEHLVVRSNFGMGAIRRPYEEVMERQQAAKSGAGGSGGESSAGFILRGTCLESLDIEYYLSPFPLPFCLDCPRVRRLKLDFDEQDPLEELLLCDGPLTPATLRPASVAVHAPTVSDFFFRGADMTKTVAVRSSSLRSLRVHYAKSLASLSVDAVLLQHLHVASHALQELFIASNALTTLEIRGQDGRRLYENPPKAHAVLCCGRLLFLSACCPHLQFLRVTDLAFLQEIVVVQRRPPAVAAGGGAGRGEGFCTRLDSITVERCPALARLRLARGRQREEGAAAGAAVAMQAKEQQQGQPVSLARSSPPYRAPLHSLVLEGCPALQEVAVEGGGDGEGRERGWALTGPARRALEFLALSSPQIKVSLGGKRLAMSPRAAAAGATAGASAATAGGAGPGRGAAAGAAAPPPSLPWLRKYK